MNCSCHAHLHLSDRSSFTQRHGFGCEACCCVRTDAVGVRGGVSALQDAGLLSGLLGCFGQLFTATVAPGWAPQQQDSLYTAAADPGISTISTTDGDLAPQAIVTLRNNEVTRVKANLEAAAFESAVSPRIAVRLLHMLLLAVAHKFGSGSSKRLEVIHKVRSICTDLATAIFCAAPSPCINFGPATTLWYGFLGL